MQMDFPEGQSPCPQNPSAMQMDFPARPEGLGGLRPPLVLGEGSPHALASQVKIHLLCRWILGRPNQNPSAMQMDFPLASLWVRGTYYAKLHKNLVLLGLI